VGLRKSTTSVHNLRRAFDRIVRGSNREYKQYFRHLYPSYTLAESVLLQRLSTALRTGTYRPRLPTIVYQPKKTGVLRPITLLCLEDQIVYQALVNRVADRFHADQQRHALTRRFGALYAGKTSDFFFRSWKVAYGRYNQAIARAFNGGRQWVAEFDLVSCYELIDHSLLRACLAKRVADDDLLDQLCECLGTWTTNVSGSHVRHGIPQGPEASAFLAEVVMFRFDEAPLKDVTYLRYIDDIRLLAKDEIPARKAMIHLDLISKDLGLVPQAQKMGVRKCMTIEEILKTVPSALVAVRPPGYHAKQPELLKMWSEALVKIRGRWEVDDPTHFRFAVYRLRGRRRVLRRNATLLLHRPDLAPTLAYYFRHYSQDREAADLLLAGLALDPAYDASAAAYVDALSGCEPTTRTAPYRRAVQTARRRSVENSLLLRSAALRFRGRRMGAKDLIGMLSKERDPHVVGLVLAWVCDGAGGEPFTLSSLAAYLETLIAGPDADLARFSAALLLGGAADAGRTWTPSHTPHSAVVDLLVAVGLRKRGARRRTAIDLYLERFGVVAPLNWKKALGRDLADAERRAVRLQHLRLTDPSAFVLMLDTFNETLVYAFSNQNPTLAPAFTAAAGSNLLPDYGNWLGNGIFQTELPSVVPWLQAIHSLRLDADLAHSKHKKGPKKGTPTRKISHKQVGAALGKARSAWDDLIHAWQPLL
jgi:hypothetical protein